MLELGDHDAAGAPRRRRARAASSASPSSRSAITARAPSSRRPAATAGRRRRSRDAAAARCARPRPRRATGSCSRPRAACGSSACSRRCAPPRWRRRPLDAVPPALRRPRRARGLGFLRVFRYPSTRILAAAITALLLSFIIGPWFIERLQGAPDRRDDPRRRPADAQEEGRHADDGRLADPVLPRASRRCCGATCATSSSGSRSSVTVAFGAIGFADDYAKVAKKNKKGISGKLRLLLEFAIAGARDGVPVLLERDGAGRAAAPAAAVHELLRASHRAAGVGLRRSFGAFVVVGTANAVNLTDGLDGLAIGPSIMNAGTFLIFAYIAGVATTLLVRRRRGPVTIARVPPHRAHRRRRGARRSSAPRCSAPASASSGTTRTPRRCSWATSARSALGGAIGMLAVLTKNELVLLIVGGLFVVEALSVIIQVRLKRQASTARSASACSAWRRSITTTKAQGLGRAEDHRPVLAGVRAARARRARHAEAALVGAGGSAAPSIFRTRCAS